jgi:hypothetical protein
VEKDYFFVTAAEIFQGSQLDQLSQIEEQDTKIKGEHPIFATTGGESIPRLIVQVLLRGLLL